MLTAVAATLVCMRRRDDANAETVPTTPTTAARGATVTVTVNGTHFLTGVSANFGAGITVNTVTRTSESKVAFAIKIDATATTGNRTVLVFVPGTGPGFATGAAASFTFTVT